MLVCLSDGALLNCRVNTRVRGPLTDARLSEALADVQRRLPPLRVRIVDSRYYTEEDVPAISLRILDCDESSTSAVVEEELSIPIAVERGPLFSVIFIGCIGLPVLRATLKALGRPGVITTAGWRQGMNPSTLRAIECMNRHVRVHMHYARYSEGEQAESFAEQNGWIPPVDDEKYSWDGIPQLADDYASGKSSTYLPLFQINPL